MPTFGVFRSQDVFEIKRFRFYFSEKSKFGVLFFPQQLTRVVALLVQTRLPLKILLIKFLFYFSLDFTVYLPDLFGGDNDQVETHVSEPTEPIDVRKNRQLTLDNMKLHRELEKLKQTKNEHDFGKTSRPFLS